METQKSLQRESFPLYRLITTDSMTPRILAIIVNWNKREHLNAMLTSLRASGLPGQCDAVVVDNASSDGSVEMVRERHPWCHLLQLPENIGGTGGFNAGMRYGLESETRYDFFWLMDNDILVHPGAGEALLRVLQRDDTMGMVGSTILVLGDPSHVQQCGVRLRWSRGALETIYEGPVTQLPQQQLIEADFVSACSLMVRTEAVRNVGLWDPAYFVFWDDVEWGVRFKRAGWSVATTTESLVEHESYENRRGRSAVLSLYQSFRNAFYFFWRFCPPSKRTKLLYRQFRATLALSDNYRAAGRYREARALRLAIKDFFAGRMGAPPRDQLDAPVPDASAPGQAEPGKGSLQRIALLACSNPDVMRTMHRHLTESYGAEVDTILLNPSPEMLREDLPRRQIARISNFFQRITLGVRLAVAYDAVASPSFQQPYLFERGAALRLRVGEDLSVEPARRNIGDMLFLSLRRVAIVPTAAVLAARAALRRPSPVDYFRFKK